MYKLLLIIFIFFTSSISFALDLKEALVAAYNNNDELKTIRYEFLAEIEQFPEALSTFLPRVSINIATNRNKTDNNSRFSSSTSNTEMFKNHLVIEQSVFSGGSSLAELKAAQSGFRSSRGKFYSQEQQIILDAIKSYLVYYEAQEKYSIFEDSVKNNTKQLDAAQEKLRLGEFTETEVASARAGRASAQTNLVSAYAELTSTKANFIRIHGIDPDTLETPELPNNIPKSLDELLEVSLSLNPVINKAKHDVNIIKAKAVAAHGALLPQVNFRVETGRDFFNPEDRTRGLTNKRSIDSVLSIQIPILSQGGAEYSRIRKANLKTRELAVKLDAQLKQNKAQCISIWEGFNAARSKMDSSIEGQNAAQIAYDGTVQEELVGLKSVLDVLNAEDRLNKAKLSKIEARKDYIFAAYQMKSLIGQLTAKSLELSVDYFNPEKEFRKTKVKIIGFQ